jgi:ketosteroid isomerase-like protein
MNSSDETLPMTKEQRKDIALKYMKGVDRPGEIISLFADDAEAFFPKWGVASGRDQILQMFADLGTILASLRHDYAHFNYHGEGDVLVVEGTSAGVTVDGFNFRSGVTHAGNFADIFEIRGFKIHRLYVYLDPDYWGADTQRYPWLLRDEQWPKLGRWTS